MKGYCCKSCREIIVDSFILLRACTWGLGPQGAPWREEAEERQDAMSIVWQPWLKWQESTAERRREAGRGHQPSSRKLRICIRGLQSPCRCDKQLAGRYKRLNSALLWQDWGAAGGEPDTGKRSVVGKCTSRWNTKWLRLENGDSFKW